LGARTRWSLAIREASVLRVVIAAFVAGVARLFGIRGVFYRVCGTNVAAIDGP